MESSNLSSLKSRVQAVLKNGGVPPESLLSDCKDFIGSVILDGIHSNTRYQVYCAYLEAISKEYVFDFSKTSPAWVSIIDNNITISINLGVLLLYVKSESQIVFILTHEVKHILFKHLLKYKALYKEDVTALFCNLATDVEVNESIKRELVFVGEYSVVSVYKHESFPKSMFDLSAMSRLLGIEDRDLLLNYNRSKGGLSLADFLYKKLNNKCLETLGYTIGEILYQCKVNRVLFCNELFLVARGEKYTFFKIEDDTEAKRFCSYLIRYLTYYKKVYTISMGTDNTENKDYLKGIDSSKLEVDNIDDLSEAIFESNLSDILELGKSILDSLPPNIRCAGMGMGSIKDINYKEQETLVPWQSVLKRRAKFLSEKCVSTKKRINRRQPHRLELSGKRREVEFSIVICLDESSSISDTEYYYFISEVSEIIKNFNCDLHLYEFTYGVADYNYYKSSKVQNALLGKNSITTTRHSGGTSFQPVFDAINKNKNINAKNTLVIMFTDGEGECEVDFGKVCNRLWILVGKNGILSCNEEDKNVFSLVDRQEVD